MGWILKLHLDTGTLDLASAVLWDAGTTGIAHLDADGAGSTLLAGFETEGEATAAAAIVGHSIPPASTLGPMAVNPVDESAWVDPDRRRTEPVAGHDIVLAPGAAFGDGQHPTTRLALDLLALTARRGTDPGARSQPSSSARPGSGPRTGPAAMGSGAGFVSAPRTGPAAAGSSAGPGSWPRTGPAAAGSGSGIGSDAGPGSAVLGRVLDFGAGTGILALAALAHGARSAMLVENDPVAIEALRTTLALNSTLVDGRHVEVATELPGSETERPAHDRAPDLAGAPAGATRHPETPGGGRTPTMTGETPAGAAVHPDSPTGATVHSESPAGFDLVLANVLLPVHQAWGAELLRRRAAGAPIVISGVLAEQEEAVRQAYPGLATEHRAVKGDWLAMVLR